MAKKSAQSVGRNVEVEVTGNKLTLTIDLSDKTEPSGSGKTNIVATTQGNKQIGDGWFVGLNVYRYAKRR
jgi:hypothetical protein